jgi:hypothetical protein
MWGCPFIDTIFGLREISEGDKTLYCKIDLETDRKFKEIATSMGESPPDYLREIVYEKIGDFRTGRRRFDLLTAEIDALRYDLTSAIEELRREISVGSLNRRLPPIPLPGATVQECSHAKGKRESSAPPADAINDGWERRDRRRRQWGRW